MQPAITGSPAWQTTILGCIIGLAAGKANIDADALSRVSWPGCMPDNTNNHIKVTAPAMQAVQEAALQGPVCPIEAYSSDLHVLDVL